MLSRTLEVLLVALLIMLTLGVAFQFQNQQLLRDILTELREERTALHIALNSAPPTPAPAPIPAVTQPATLPAGPQITVAAPAPVQEAQQPAPAPEAAPVAEAPAPAPAPPAPKPVVKAEPKPAPPAAAAAPVVAAPAPAKPEPDPKIEEAWQNHAPIVTQVVTDMYEGKYDRVVKRLNPTLAAVLPPDSIAAAMAPVQKHGAFRGIVDHELLSGTLEPSLRGWRVVAEQTDGTRTEFCVTLDDQNRIAGLLMK